VAVLKRLFYPLTFSYLVPIVQLHASLGDDRCFHLQGRIDIVNRGHASASEVFVEFAGAQLLSLNTDDWEKGPRNLTTYQAFKSIHPGQSLCLARNLSSRSDFTDWPSAERFETFTMRVYAKDSMPICRRFKVLWTELRTAFENNQNKVTIEGENAS
jgi:hypothetical protein